MWWRTRKGIEEFGNWGIERHKGICWIFGFSISQFPNWFSGENRRETVKGTNDIARWFAAISLAALFVIPLPVLAQRPLRAGWQQRRAAVPLRPRRGGHAGDWLRRYKDVPSNEQERALQNDPQFRHLPPARQQQLRRQLQQFTSLPPQQQQRVLNRMETWEHLTPDQKRQARQIFGQMQQLPPERRQMVNNGIRELRSLPPDQREQVVNSERFKSYSPRERDMMREAARLPFASSENGEQ